MLLYKCADNSEGRIHSCAHGKLDNPCDNLHLYSRHFHTSCEMLLVVKGDVHYNIDGNSYVLQPYDILLIPPTTYHFLIPKSNTEYENYTVNLRMDLGDERMKKLFSPPYIINIAGDSILRRMFSLVDFYYETFTKEDLGEALEHLISEIIMCLSYKSKEEPDRSRAVESNTLIAEITSYIAKNLDRELNAEVISKHMNFSRSYVQNQFSKVMGIGLKQYINQKKIYASHADIQNGLSPNQAAQKYRFEDYSSFFRQYKKILGISPKDGKG